MSRRLKLAASGFRILAKKNLHGSAESGPASKLRDALKKSASLATEGHERRCNAHSCSWSCAHVLDESCSRENALQ